MSRSQTPEQQFALQVRHRRIAQGVTQQAVADALLADHGIRIDATAITRIESGRRSIRLNEADAIAQVLGMTVADLFSVEVNREWYVQEAQRLSNTLHQIARLANGGQA